MIGKMTQTKRYHFNLAFSLKGKLHIQKLFTLDMKSKYGKDLDKDFLSKMGEINDQMRVSFFKIISSHRYFIWFS